LACEIVNRRSVLARTNPGHGGRLCGFLDLVDSPWTAPGMLLGGEKRTTPGANRRGRSMDGTRLLLFRVRGIPVYVDLSWFPVLGLLTWSLAEETFGPSRGDLSAAGVWLLAGATAIAFFACIILHELGHALIGRANGVPFRGITLFLFGGVAELDREPPSAKSEFRMAMAGPAVSAVLAIAFGVVAVLGNGIEAAAPAVLMLEQLAWVNAAILAFNLVPAFPLDGGRVFRAAAWAWTGDLGRSTRWAATAGRGFGLFLANVARRSYEAFVVTELLGGCPVARFMTPAPVTVPPDLDLRTLVEDYVYRFHRKAFPVVTCGKVVGLVRADAVREIPQAEWGRHTVVDVMGRDVDGLLIAPRAAASEALRQMQRTGSTRLLVVDVGRLVGILSLRDLMEYLDLTLPVGDDKRPTGRSGARQRRDRPEDAGGGPPARGTVQVDEPAVLVHDPAADR
jgi:Zn-dependent protease